MIFDREADLPQKFGSVEHHGMEIDQISPGSGEFGVEFQQLIGQLNRGERQLKIVKQQFHSLDRRINTTNSVQGNGFKCLKGGIETPLLFLSDSQPVLTTWR